MDANVTHSELTKAVALTLLAMGWTVSRVATATGVNRETVQRWRDEVVPDRNVRLDGDGG